MPNLEDSSLYSSSSAVTGKMAEAHVAVGFQFAVTDEGIHVNLNLEALKAVFNSGRRSWMKKLWRIKVGFLKEFN